MPGRTGRTPAVEALTPGNIGNVSNPLDLDHGSGEKSSMSRNGFQVSIGTRRNRWTPAAAEHQPGEDQERYQSPGQYAKPRGKTDTLSNLPAPEPVDRPVNIIKHSARGNSSRISTQEYTVPTLPPDGFQYHRFDRVPQESRNHCIGNFDSSETTVPPCLTQKIRSACGTNRDQTRRCSRHSFPCEDRKGFPFNHFRPATHHQPPRAPQR